MKIIINQDFKWLKAGQIVECSKSIALRMISQGLASELVNEVEPVEEVEEVEPVEETITSQIPTDETESLPTPQPKRKRKPRKPRKE